MSAFTMGKDATAGGFLAGTMDDEINREGRKGCQEGKERAMIENAEAQRSQRSQRKSCGKTSASSASSAPLRFQKMQRAAERSHHRLPRARALV